MHLQSYDQYCMPGLCHKLLGFLFFMSAVQLAHWPCLQGLLSFLLDFCEQHCMAKTYAHMIIKHSV